ncbi:MAG: hypothetical protein ACYSTZ_09555 [Planctomycetota bacterium]|jgi:hypothetical protein
MKKLIPAFLVAAMLLFPAQFISLGQVDVATAGTPVQITSAYTLVNSVIIRSLDDNDGKIWIGTSDLDNSSMVGVIFYLNPGDAWSSGTQGMNEINPSELYIDCESGNTDSVIASILVR